MRAVIQRVSMAEVFVDNQKISSIGEGIVVFLGIKTGDQYSDLEYMVRKITRLRIFEDEKGKMNSSILDVGGDVLVVSQFTLYGDCRRGNRPSFDKAAGSTEAEEIYRSFIDRLKEEGLNVKEGSFGSFMKVSLKNNGPVTILLDSEKLF